jgi:uncharacterized protein YjbI with pentapeptide repeats
VSKPPEQPYPPDLAAGEEPDAEFADELVDRVVEDADWANLRSTRFAARRVELRRCRLTGIELGGGELTDVSLVECRLDLAGLRFAKLRRVVFRDCRLEECDLYGASLEDVLFEDCTLREAELSTARLQQVELRRCDLAGLRGAASLRGVRMPWSDAIENAPLFAAALGVELVD